MKNENSPTHISVVDRPIAIEGETVENELELLLRESEASCRLRERSSFDEMIGRRSEFVLFGAGGLGRKIASRLRDAGIKPLAFADNKIAGQTRDEIQVLSPAEAAERFGQSAVFVVCIWASWADTMASQIKSLKSFGCITVVPFIPLLWKYPDLLPHTQIDLPSRVLSNGDDIRRCFGLWSDKNSRREFLSQLRWRLFGDFESLNAPIPDEYFQRDLVKLNSNAVFVDAGAFNGDTLSQFIQFTGGRFRAAYAFEPDSKNTIALRDRVNMMSDQVRSRIQVFENAVADKEIVIQFQGGAGASSAPGSGNESVRCIALDNALPEIPDFIKFDIEGFELLGLEGSRRIISEAHPSLAVCSYHLQDHLSRIPLLIHSFNRNYQFHLRPHGQVWETVCYAIPTYSVETTHSCVRKS